MNAPETWPSKVTSDDLVPMLAFFSGTGYPATSVSTNMKTSWGGRPPLDASALSTQRTLPSPVSRSPARAVVTAKASGVLSKSPPSTKSARDAVSSVHRPARPSSLLVGQYVSSMGAKASGNAVEANRTSRSRAKATSPCSSSGRSSGSPLPVASR